MEEMKLKAESFNKLRLEYHGCKFSREALTEVLNNAGFPKSKAFLTELIKKQCIIKTSPRKGCQYYFCENPIHFARIAQVFVDFRAIMKANKLKSRQQSKQTVTEEPVFIIQDPIKTAISLLKENGYKVYKQVITYEEI